MSNYIYNLRCRLHNFGDSLNIPLIEKISGKQVISMNKKGLESRKFKKEDTIYAVIGSIMGWCGHPNVEVWGSGFISSSTTITNIQPPKKIHAVRGILTRDILLKKGIKCPAIFGDPALLMPRFYNPKLKKKYELSVIPHHIDKVLIPKLKKQFPKAYFIDIQQDVYKFIDEIISSEAIITSSLHGQIIADAYNIPNAWIKLSQKVLGHGFKMLDYYSSVNRQDKQALVWTKKLTTQHIDDKLKKWNSPKIDLNMLYNSCPFKKEK